MLNLLPTGDTSIDTDIAVIACQCKHSAQIALRAIDRIYVKLAFEICSHKKDDVPEDLKTPLVDLCIHNLTNEDTYILLAAMRCIIALDEAEKVPPNSIMIQMQSNTETL